MRVPSERVYVIRLGAYLEATGTRPAWLATQIGVGRSVLHGWLMGHAPVPDRRRQEILKVLRRRNLEPLTDLFESEDAHG